MFFFFSIHFLLLASSCFVVQALLMISIEKTVATWYFPKQLLEDMRIYLWAVFKLWIGLFIGRQREALI